jgi:hypothetical protein
VAGSGASRSAIYYDLTAAATILLSYLMYLSFIHNGTSKDNDVRSLMLFLVKHRHDAIQLGFI